MLLTTIQWIIGRYCHAALHLVAEKVTTRLSVSDDVDCSADHHPSNPPSVLRELLVEKLK